MLGCACAIRCFLLAIARRVGAGFRAEAVNEGAEVQRALPEPARQEMQPRPARGGRPPTEEVINGLGDDAGMIEAVGLPRARVMARARPRRRLNSPPAQPATQSSDNMPEESPSLAPNSQSTLFGDEVPDRGVFQFGSGSDIVDATVQQRPGMPTRNALTRAAEVQRMMEEENWILGQQDWPSLQVYRGHTRWTFHQEFSDRAN